MMIVKEFASVVLFSDPGPELLVLLLRIGDALRRLI
jgi:hypothetical protein